MPFRFYAHQDLIGSEKINMADLIHFTQLLPRSYQDKSTDKFLIFTRNNISITDIELLKEGMKNQLGWAFLPTHLKAHEWPDIVEFETDLGGDGFVTPICANWRQGGGDKIKKVIDSLSKLSLQV